MLLVLKMEDGRQMPRNVGSLKKPEKARRTVCSLSPTKEMPIIGSSPVRHLSDFWPKELQDGTLVLH